MLKSLNLSGLFRSASVLACLAAASTAFAAGPTVTNLTVTESSTVYDENNVVCAADADAPLGYGSLASDGTGKTDMYFTPAALFGRDVLLGEIASISYYTKTGATHDVDPRDWYLTIYTKPFAGDVSTPTWYGSRIGAEPYFAINPTDVAGQWTQWSTGGPDNQLRFFESTAGAPGATFGSYTDPNFATFVGGNSLAGVPYATQEVLSFSLQTASGWANGFTGQLDAFQIVLTDGSIATVDFECDDDGDGVVDADDHCPNSDLRDYVDVGSGPTSIENTVDEDGCSIQDLVNQCQAQAKNHGQYVSCVVQLANQLAISKSQRQEMKTGAAKSSIGK